MEFVLSLEDNRENREGTKITTTVINECFRLERNFRVPLVKKKKKKEKRKRKKRFLKRFTFRQEVEKKEEDPAVSVSIFHPPLASLSIFIVTRLEPLSRSFRAPPFDESFRGGNDVSVTELDNVEKDVRAW